MWATDLLTHFLQTIVFLFVVFVLVCFHQSIRISNKLLGADRVRHPTTTTTTTTTTPTPPAPTTPTTPLKVSLLLRLLLLLLLLLLHHQTPLRKRPPSSSNKPHPPLLWTSSPPFNKGEIPQPKGSEYFERVFPAKKFLEWMQYFFEIVVYEEEAPFIENSAILAWENVTLFTLTSLHQMQ